jgi:hypothetical protein
MGAFEDYISGSFQGLARGARELPENIANWARPAAQEGIKGYDGALTGTDLPYYGDDEISAAREHFDRQPRSNTSRLVDLIGNYMPGMTASKVAPVAVRAGETVLGAGPAFKQRVAETALDMAPEARAARAEKQGYTIDAYKGDAVDRPYFDNPGRPYAGFFSSDPSVSNRFAEGYAGSYQGADGATDGILYPTKIRMTNPYIIDAQGQKAGMLQFGRSDLAREYEAAINSKKHDGVILKNTADEGEVYIPKTPQQVRSRFAAFDPKQKKSPDLLAASANPLASLNEIYRNREER